jgi:hypothetical protein
MFNFNTYNTESVHSCSTGLSGQKYESDLIQILSLPLSCANRQLEMPNLITKQCQDYHIFGEGHTYQTFEAKTQSSDATNSLNDLCYKMNSDVVSANNDTTNHETLELFTIACNKNLDGEDHEDLTKILIDLKTLEHNNSDESSTPDVMTAQASTMYVKASEITMDEEEQEKKGLLGLKFKAVKLVHPITKRSRTKFICTFNGCGKECENKWSFLDHNRHHTGARPYECNVCHKKFTQRGNLRQHKMIHKRK